VKSPLIPRELIEPLQYFTANEVRGKYVSAMLVRFGYFLSQGVTLSLTGFDRTAAESSRIDSVAVVNALRNTLTADSIEELAAPINDLPQNISKSDIQTDLFSKNFASMAKLIRTELKHIEEGTYKFPYDLDPTDKYAREQWNPVSVISRLSEYVTDRRSVLVSQSTRMI